jgi:ABC-type transporter Mla subunit MlaD
MIRSPIYFLLIFSFLLSSCSHQNRYTILLENANGLQKGSEVVFNGVTVGNVLKLKLLEDIRVVLTISLDKDFKIPIGSKFQIQTPLIGSTRLILEKSNESRIATKQDTLYGYVDTTNIRSLINDSTKRKAINKIVEGFQELIEGDKKDTVK